MIFLNSARGTPSNKTSTTYYNRLMVGKIHQMITAANKICSEGSTHLNAFPQIFHRSTHKKKKKEILFSHVFRHDLIIEVCASDLQVFLSLPSCTQRSRIFKSGTCFLQLNIDLRTGYVNGTGWRKRKLDSGHVTQNKNRSSRLRNPPRGGDRGRQRRKTKSKRICIRC